MAPERSVAKVRRRTRETAKRARYLGGIAEGVAHKASHAVPGANRQREPLDDVALAQKVESEAFRHPGVSNVQRKRQYEISREEALPQPASERQRGLERVQQQHWGAPARRAPMRRPAYRALRVSAHTKAAGDGSSTHAHAPLCSLAPATAGNRASPESSPLRSQRTKLGAAPSAPAALAFLTERASRHGARRTCVARKGGRAAPASPQRAGANVAADPALAPDDGRESRAREAVRPLRHGERACCSPRLGRFCVVATDRLVGVHRDVCLLDEGGSL
jgi:hypothetical protein